VWGIIAFRCVNTHYYNIIKASPNRYYRNNKLSDTPLQTTALHATVPDARFAPPTARRCRLVRVVRHRLAYEAIYARRNITCVRAGLWNNNKIKRFARKSGQDPFFGGCINCVNRMIMWLYSRLGTEDNTVFSLHDVICLRVSTRDSVLKFEINHKFSLGHPLALALATALKPVKCQELVC